VAFLKIWDVLLHPTKNGGVGQGNVPQGKLTLTLNANPTVKNLLLRFLAA
jgi:hypothetical protein